MGLGLQVAAAASTFSFKEIISIELSQEDVDKTLIALNNSRIYLPPIEIKIGRVQVYSCLSFQVTPFRIISLLMLIYPTLIVIFLGHF